MGTVFDNELHSTRKYEDRTIEARYIARIQEGDHTLCGFISFLRLSAYPQWYQENIATPLESSEEDEEIYYPVIIPDELLAADGLCKYIEDRLLAPGSSDEAIIRSLEPITDEELGT